MTQQVRNSLRGLRGPATGLLLLLVGLFVGAGGYAFLGPFHTDIPPEVQNGVLILSGALIAASIALLGAWWAASVSAEGAVRAAAMAAEAAQAAAATTASSAREQATIDAKRALVRRIVSLGNRHAQDVANQFAARQEHAGSLDDTEIKPELDPTTPIEDAVNELYALGAQHTADVAWVMLRSLWELERYGYDSSRDRDTAGLIKRVPLEDVKTFAIWHEVQRSLKTYVIDAHLEDVGGPRLRLDGTLGSGDLLVETFEIVRAAKVPHDGVPHDPDKPSVSGGS